VGDWDDVVSCTIWRDGNEIADHRSQVTGVRTWPGTDQYLYEYSTFQVSPVPNALSVPGITKRETKQRTSRLSAFRIA
jgi:hypothetical protein